MIDRSVDGGLIDEHDAVKMVMSSEINIMVEALFLELNIMENEGNETTNEFTDFINKISWPSNDCSSCRNWVSCSPFG